MNSSTSQIEIRSQAIKKNIQFIRSLIGTNVTISAVVKGNAYGHGVHLIVPLLEELGVNHFAVYSSPEAKAALNIKSEKSAIMIMGFIYREDFKWVIKNQIEFYVSNHHVLKQAIAIAKELNTRAIIHIDLETGMNRTGFTISRLRIAIPMILENINYLEIKGITTHLAGAESIANYLRIKKQISVFKKRLSLMESKGIYAQLKHIASSAATITYPESRMDLVRVGILLYGYWPTNETFIHYIHERKGKGNPLERAIKWTTVVIAKKIVPEGEFIGYGISFQAQQKMKICILPVGYCNGYSRSLSNTGHIIIHGQKAPVIGSVNMNMILCDITHIDNVQVGDQAILIGKQDNMEISFSSFAEMNNAMNYEILARLPENIKRIIK